ncbi:SulP family inorganic anion transporter [Bacillus suaedae]|uniref:Sodium-independent anion transporter n=1 Tax=Halalkalibacter suaedae TaxID=2822140 RepID=A0A940WVE0_9BACI|nr:SulP family inorganic anion transporter [Bacillus suaedae]MBP3951018.1 sodium-independent anion transporter [Bacillus suaedae]
MGSGLFPIIHQLSKYSRHSFFADLYAAFMVALLLIPQGMAYAILAGLPPVYGLYAAIFPAIIYSLLGSSRQLSVGPVAVIAIMTFTEIAKIATPGSIQYISLVIFLTLLVGLLQMLMAICRVGSLMRYISPSVLRGFTSALALTIILNQLGQLIDVTFAKELPFFFALLDLIKQFPEAQFASVAFTAILIVIYGCSLVVKKVPTTLLFIISSTLLVSFFTLEDFQIKTIGVIPSGLPDVEFPVLILEHWHILIPLALFISLISFLESFAMAQALNKKAREALDPNQELFALGMANTVGSFFSSFPVAGAFSRSAVSEQAGARTALSSLLAAIMVILALSYLTSAFIHLPQSALAIIIVLAARKLIHLPALSEQWNIDTLLVSITFLSSLLLGIKLGFIVGVSLSFVLSIIGKYIVKEK